MNIRVSKIHPKAKIPQGVNQYQEICAVFYDPYGYTYLRPGQTEEIKTGLVFDIPEGYELCVKERIELSCSGVITSSDAYDSNYRGDLTIVLTNTSQDLIRISEGDKVALCKIQPATYCEFMEKENNG